MTARPRDRAPTTAAIACSVDASYTLPLLVMLASLRRAVSPARPPRLLLFHSALPDDHLAAIASLVETAPVVVPSSILAAIPAHRHFPPEAALPLLIGELIPDGVERVLFLDADMLVLEDPTPLLDVDLGGRALGAVVDGAIPRCSAPRGVLTWRELGIPAFAPYFNAGVMAISLREWRERDVGGRALRYLSTRRGRSGFLHQEALNATACDDWLDLDPRWNVLARQLGSPHRAQPIPERPAIVHFAGHMKPWRGRTAGPYDESYRTALAEVAPSFALPRRGLRDRALSAYDRRLRDRLFPLERFLWQRGVI